MHGLDGDLIGISLLSWCQHHCSLANYKELPRIHESEWNFTMTVTYEGVYFSDHPSHYRFHSDGGSFFLSV